MDNIIFTVGHSNHPIEKFIDLLRKHGVTAIADVRSNPFSRWTPHFSRASLDAALADAGIVYMFFGRELGARSANPACYIEGRVQYDLLSQQSAYHEGINRLIHVMAGNRLALMCAEKEPMQCHRALLVSRTLGNNDIQVQHIYADGTLESHEDFELRLLKISKLSHQDMLRSRAELISDAYAIQSKKVAHADKSMTANAAV